MKNLVLITIFLLLLVSKIASANELNFIGLDTVESKTNVSVETSASEVDIREGAVVVGSVSNDLDRAGILLETLFRHYNNIVHNAETDDGRYLRTKSKISFARMLVSCRSFTEALSRVRNILIDLETRFRVCNVAKMSRSELLILAPQMAKHAQYVTTYNLLFDFASSRQINCDAIKPLDEQTSLIVTQWRLDRARFIRALYEWKYTSNDNVGTFNSQLVRPLMIQAKELVERAMQAKAELRANGRLKVCDDGREFLHFDCSPELFSSIHKNQMLTFSRAFIELRALRNAILTYVILSKGQSIDPIFHYQWNELNDQFWQITTWGTQTNLSCPATDGKLSTFNMVLDKSFQRSYLLTEPPSLVASIISAK